MKVAYVGRVWPKVMQGAGLAGCVVLGGCHLVDRTTFNPALRASRNPPAEVKPTAPTRIGPPPLLTIRFDHPTDYSQALRMAVTQATARKPDVEFLVTTVVAASGTHEDQLQAVRQDGGDARRIASDIVGMGVDQGQVVLSARAEPGVQGHEVRIYVR